MQNRDARLREAKFEMLKRHVLCVIEHVIPANGKLARPRREMGTNQFAPKEAAATAVSDLVLCFDVLGPSPL